MYFEACFHDSNIDASSLQTRDPTTKRLGKHFEEISKFEKYYQFEYNPFNMDETVRLATKFIYKQMKLRKNDKVLIEKYIAIPHCYKASAFFWTRLPVLPNALFKMVDLTKPEGVCISFLMF